MATPLKDFYLLLLLFVLYCHQAKLGFYLRSCHCTTSDSSRGNIQIDNSTVNTWKPQFLSIFCDNDYRMSSPQIYPPFQNKILCFSWFCTFLIVVYLEGVTAIK